MAAMKQETLKDMPFFINGKGKIEYNSKCKECENKCKQSFRSEVVICPKYKGRKKTTQTGE